MGTQRIKFDIFYVLSVDIDVTGSWIIEPEKKSKEGRFAESIDTSLDDKQVINKNESVTIDYKSVYVIILPTPAGSNYGYLLASWHHKADAVQNRSIWMIAKGDVFKSNFTAAENELFRTRFILIT